MRDIGSYITVKRLVAEAILTASASAVVTDRGSNNNQRSEALTYAFHVGAGGITFTGTNFIALKLEESDDNVTYNVVAGAPVAGQGGGAILLGKNADATQLGGQQPDVNGYVRLIAVAHATADVDPFKVSYVGNKRYVRATIVFGGTHGTGTLVGLYGILGFPDILPAG